MAENKIEIKSVQELLGMKFFIPSYQRGYRWTKQQVEDLLEDIWEFSKKKKQEYEFYCLQPLVVKLMSNNDKQKAQLNINEEWYEVIDGQQRLTTILLILYSLKDTISDLGLPTQLYELKYKRESEDFKVISFLDGLNSGEIDDSHIDLFFMSSAFEAIKSWMEKNKVNKENFCNTLLKSELDKNQDKPRDKANNVRFIWYDTDEKDAIKVFTRLNIGKISLTNAELIKAMFLNRSNFGNESGDHLRLRQQEIANEWDNIEYTLQNEEFWLFLHKKDYDRPTRIDFIFDLICDKKSLGEFENIGTDEYKTFRYFYEYFKQNNAKIERCWTEVKKYFHTFLEWFNDLELYHYVGYLVECNYSSITELVETWKSQSSKESFVDELKKIITEKIRNCNDLYKQYEIDNASKKAQCRPLLLLHNIQTLINKSKDFTSKKEYEFPVFYKFPFHLFKKEKWDVEHIDSNSENDMSSKDSQNEFLLNIYHSVDGKMQEKIEAFINNPEADNWKDFSEYTKKAKDSLSDEDKNKVWNFTLLDSSTNRSYGNSIFAAKRRIIIGKDRGVSLPIPKIKKEKGQSKLSIGEEEKAETAFIPPCTKNIFMKYYTPVLTNYNYWTRTDAESYRQNIFETLNEFGVTDSSNNQNEENNEQQ